jgi:adenine-specific DNA-methyltransferase
MDFKQKYGPAWKIIRFHMKRELAYKYPDRIVSLNTLQKPSKKIEQVLNISKKERNKVFVIERENDSPIYCYNGRTLAFFADKFKEINGKKVPAEVLTNLWLNVSFLGIGPEGNVNLPNGKKPELLIKYLIEIATKKDDLVLDFFIGTGTTCAVAHKMNRQYIGIEQLDYGNDSAINRLKNVISGDQTGISKEVDWQGGGDFVYMELSKLNEFYVEKIRDVKTTEEVLNIWGDMKHNGFLSYSVDPRLFDENIEEFKVLKLEEQKKLLLDMLDYNDLYVNYSEIDDAIYNISERDKKLNKKFYEG